MTRDLKDNLTRRESWQRLLYIILFALIYSVAELVLAVVVIVQLGFVLVSGRRNPNLLALGAGLSRFAYEVLMYVTYNADERPFPFADWPPVEGFPRAPFRPAGASGGRSGARRRATKKPSRRKTKTSRSTPAASGDRR